MKILPEPLVAWGGGVIVAFPVGATYEVVTSVVITVVMDISVVVIEVDVSSGISVVTVDVVGATLVEVLVISIVEVEVVSSIVEVSIELVVSSSAVVVKSLVIIVVRVNVTVLDPEQIGAPWALLVHTGAVTGQALVGLGATRPLSIHGGIPVHRCPIGQHPAPAPVPKQAYPGSQPKANAPPS